MKLLAICIPNYNRIDKLERLIKESIRQIVENDLVEDVQICISDDCSPLNPEQMIELIRSEYPMVEILFRRNVENKGMDSNFLQSVLMASSTYCWIIGNDDVPVFNGIKTVVNILRQKKNIDIILTPFDIYDEDENMRGTIYPLKEKKEIIFDTSNKQQYENMLFSVTHNSGLFGFLSNVIFKKEKWSKYEDKFKNKLNTIFIQMYMNIQTLEEGALLLYTPYHIIKNYSDDETNNKIERICAILFGLNGVVEYFFEGKVNKYLKKILVDTYISGIVWELPENNLNKKKVREIDSLKNKMYKKYFVQKENRKNFFDKKKVFIYGAGNYGKKVYQELKQYNTQILGIADSDKAKENTIFDTFEIISVEKMLKLYEQQESYIIVANHFALENMINYLRENKVENIVIIC